MDVRPPPGPATDETPQFSVTSGTPVVPLSKSWVLDVGCGTASLSHAALLMGHNAFAFDYDDHMVRSAHTRLVTFEEQPDQNGELITQTEKRKEFAGEKREEAAQLRLVNATITDAAKRAKAELKLVDKEAKQKEAQMVKEAKKKAAEMEKEAKQKEADMGKEAKQKETEMKKEARKRESEKERERKRKQME